MAQQIFPFITDGIVKDVEDPQQNGRVKIWCPALDGEHLDLDRIPWAEYATPFGGVTNNFKVGRNKTTQEGPKSYGFWAIPKIGSQVLVFLLNGDPTRRFYFASFYGMHRNRSLPFGRNLNETNEPGPWTDSYNELQPSYDNLRIAFQDRMSSIQAKNRGFFERQASQAKTEKDGVDGYAKDTSDGKYFDPQTYCLTTPGGHFIVLDDAPDNCRVRMRSTEGNQIIIDDTNERIYVSTAKGKTWIELDEDGHMHVFGSESVSVRAGKDVNLYADRDLNVEVGRHINMKALSGEFRLQAKDRIDIRSESGSIYQTACDNFHIMAKNTLYQYARDIHTRAEDSIYEESLGINGGGNSHSVVHGNRYVKVIGEVHEHFTGEYHVKTDSNAKITARTGVHLKSPNEIKMTANEISGTAEDVSFYASQKAEFDGGQYLSYGASYIHTYSSTGGSSPYSKFSIATDAKTATPISAHDAHDADNANPASGPTVVPGHEPWERPASAKPRNKNWSK